MGEIKPVQKVKLIIGEIYSNENSMSSAELNLVELFGKIDARTTQIPFDFSDYYVPEMGSALFRKWISFKNLIDPEELSDIKNKTNKIEDSFAINGKRIINLDPGYISAPNLVLASTKNFSHRIYLSSGIYAEITLIYKNRNFEFLPWTYPDYKSETALEFFKKIRSDYLKKAPA
ncbi:MAG: hypothetical protein A2252_04730 [Elusimicrobia bacterium RIFOXYA2_FULL_39_19]|nr:MAG: hypothetical protein A2252_04730 [Elusimicrobia bacterium RIFOXYA2_FULL_39_19]